MGPTTTRRGLRAAAQSLAITALVAVVAACGPPPSGPAPTWTSTRLARTASPTEVANRFGAWTDTQWFATVRAVTPIGGSGTTITLDVYPRQGPGGSQLGTPQSIPLSSDVGFGGPLGEHVVALPGTAPPGQSSTVRFYRPVAGVWGPSGSAVVPAGFQVVAVTDEWMVARRIPGDPSATGDGQVLVFAVDTSGPQVTAAQVTTLGPDPAWPTALRDGFGTSVALDGDLLAVGATGQSAPTPGGVRVFRAGPGGWAAVQSLGGTTEPSSFGRTLAVDDDATVDRLVIAPQGTSLATLSVDVLADTGNGFVPEQTLTRSANLADASNGLYWAAAVAIDGPTLAVTSRSTTVPSADPLHPLVTVGYVQIYRRGGAWFPEREVGVFTTPFDAGVRSALPQRLQLAGTNMAVSMFVTPDEPPGCIFPCFVLGFEAWSIDRI